MNAIITRGFKKVKSRNQFFLVWIIHQTMCYIWALSKLLVPLLFYRIIKYSASHQEDCNLIFKVIAFSKIVMFFIYVKYVSIYLCHFILWFQKNHSCRKLLLCLWIQAALAQHREELITMSHLSFNKYWLNISYIDLFAACLQCSSRSSKASRVLPVTHSAQATWPFSSC